MSINKYIINRYTINRFQQLKPIIILQTNNIIGRLYLHVRLFGNIPIFKKQLLCILAYRLLLCSFQIKGFLSQEIIVLNLYKFLKW